MLLPRGFSQYTSFPAWQAGGNQLQAVPMVGRAYNNYIYILIIYELPPILVKMGDLLTLNLFRVCSPLFKHRPVNVAECNAVDLGIAKESLQVGKPLSVAAYKAQVDLVVCPHRLGGKAYHHRTQSQAGTQYGALLKEISSCHCVVLLALSLVKYKNNFIIFDFKGFHILILVL